MPRDGCIYPADYGAAGTGLVDDTAAVQLAVFAAMNTTTSVHVAGWHNDLVGAAVCFSPGVYLLSDTINFTRSFAAPSGMAPSIRGLGFAALRMREAEAGAGRGDRDILNVPNAWYWRASGLTFINGRHQLRLGNNNTDEGLLKIEDCAFHNSSGAAIWTEQPLSARTNEGGALLNRGTFSTQLTVRDCKFVGCNQALVNWMDWTTVSDCWVTTSPRMTSSTAIFENWDRLFLKRILGVPGFAYPPGHNVRWIDNHAYRLSGGWVHTKEVRFGDEAGCAMNALHNFAPHLCVPTRPADGDGDLLCGTPPRAGPLPANTTGGWSSVVIEGGYLCAAGSDGKADIVLEQVPAQLVLKDTISMMGSGRFGRATFRLGDTAPDLDGPYLGNLTDPATLRFKVDDVWNVGLGDSGLPPQLWPYVDGGVYAAAAPKAGTWREGQVVWRRRGPGNGGRLGWKCVRGGRPGSWVPLEAVEVEGQPEMPGAVGAQAVELGARAGGGGGDGTVSTTQRPQGPGGVREELAALRAAVLRLEGAVAI
jgi:hypothetical protein